MQQLPITIFDYINNCLRIISNLNNQSLTSSLLLKDESIILKSKDVDLVVLKDESIKLLNNLELNYLLKSNNNLNETSLYQKLVSFFNEINDSIIGLNHLGIGYECENSETEILKYQREIIKSKLTISEDMSKIKNQRWLFIGNRKDWSTPLFELVLENKTTNKNKYNPHFQIDLDTNLSFDQLEILTNKHLKNNFFDNKIYINNYGPVLGMGRILTINGVDICLGLGTNLRNNKIHRLNELKEL